MGPIFPTRCPFRANVCHSMIYNGDAIKSPGRSRREADSHYIARVAGRWRHARGLAPPEAVRSRWPPPVTCCLVRRLTVRRGGRRRPHGRRRPTNGCGLTYLALLPSCWTVGPNGSVRDERDGNGMVDRMRQRTGRTCPQDLARSTLLAVWAPAMLACQTRQRPRAPSRCDRTSSPAYRNDQPQPRQRTGHSG